MLTIGDRVGIMTVLSLPEAEYVESSGRSRKYYRVQCDCGNYSKLRADRAARAKSCGCLSTAAASVNGKGNKTHGESTSLTYKRWCDMWDRCTNRNNPKFAMYSGRAPADRWKSYENFKADMGECPEGLTLERVNNTLGYGPDNCRWANKSEQGRNTSRGRYFYQGGRVLTMADTYKLVGVTRGAVSYRISVGGDVEALLRAKEVTALVNRVGIGPAEKFLQATEASAS
jgi:hypothetical protein